MSGVGDVGAALQDNKRVSQKLHLPLFLFTLSERSTLLRPLAGRVAVLWPEDVFPELLP